MGINWSRQYIPSFSSPIADKQSNSNVPIKQRTTSSVYQPDLAYNSRDGFIVRTLIDKKIYPIP